ncbi:MAG TPA: hypothetical protein VNR41_09070 [Xanthobacteraceae bacterium]|jgi:hypothetical protein|nr:hypothetical protein [Xanthobacteraceae bacterium]
MQTIFGFILGVALTIGVAYVHDASITAPSTTASAPTSATAPAAERQMVNWDVVGTNWRELKASVSEGWRKLQSIG